MALLFWLIMFLVFIALEAVSMALTSIWFAGGALAAFFVCSAGGGTTFQLALCTVVSVILFLCVRPAAKKLVNKRVQKTNAGSLTGKSVRITEEVDNAQWTGKGIVEGMEWMVRAKDPECIIPAGVSAKIVDIQGVKLIVTQADS